MDFPHASFAVEIQTLLGKKLDYTEVQMNDAFFLYMTPIHLWIGVSKVASKPRSKPIRLRY